jgi:phenylpropionate dioxygenase-like ring-hydroxylating dioxygenase large terminal subunit
VLGCKYHGWSYDTKGHLVKAPMFDGVPGFKKEDNGLFEIEVTVSHSGAIWVNLDSGVKNESINEDAKRSIDRFLGLKNVKTRWVDGRTVEGGFNWKKAGKLVSLNIFENGNF